MSAAIANESGHVGMRPFPNRYFELAQISVARLWLDSQENYD